MRGIVKPDGAFRDVLAHVRKEHLRACQTVRPMDRRSSCSPSARGVVLDMDSSVSPMHGEQENSVWNGHYDCTCYHPLFVFNQFGDLERCALRPGNVHSVDG
jgi:Transposase DDE domain group 1